MASVKRICVYCGSSGRVDETYRAAATRLGVDPRQGRDRAGLWRRAGRADGAPRGRGARRAAGASPASSRPSARPEVGHTGLSELLVVGNMHERKRRMFEMSDAFAVLPGGLGTLDETFEILTWKQLGLHDKPVIIVDVAGYWTPLLELIEHTLPAASPAAAACSFSASCRGSRTCCRRSRRRRSRARARAQARLIRATRRPRAALRRARELLWLRRALHALHGTHQTWRRSR